MAARGFMDAMVELELARRASGSPLVGLQEFVPVDYLDLFARTMGGGSPRVANAVAPERQIVELAEAYNLAPAFDESLVPAFDAMRAATEQQYDILTSPVRRGGLGMDVRVTEEDPYNVSTVEGLRDLLDDMRGRRMSTFSSKSTGGHPYLSNEENDMFRAVHDAFGHGATGRGFGRHGEEAAFQAHSAMYPVEALPALVAGLRGQNAFVNRFGYFGPQKLAMMPEEYMTTMQVPMSRAEQEASIADAVSRMIRQGRY